MQTAASIDVNAVASALELFAKLVEATKAANQLPADDYAFYNTFRPFKVAASPAAPLNPNRAL